jgi:hypothetical protein
MKPKILCERCRTEMRVEVTLSYSVPAHIANSAHFHLAAVEILFQGAYDTHILGLSYQPTKPYCPACGWRKASDTLQPWQGGRINDESR